MIGYRLRRTIILGMRSLALHKLRSVLTALGIIFGVSSVIAMLSIGEGANFEAQEEIKKLGSENVILQSVKVTAEGGSSGSSQQEVVSYGLTWKDFDNIVRTFPLVDRVVPMRLIPTDGRNGRYSMELQVVGTTPDYRDLGNVTLVPGGRFISESDYADMRPVVVLGAGAAAELFPAQSPLGKQVKLGQFYFTVIGVLQETGAASGTGGAQSDDRNRDVYAPLSTVDKRFGEAIVRFVSGTRSAEQVQLHQIIISVGEQKESSLFVPAVAGAARGMLEKFHVVEDYNVIVPLELLQQKERTKRIFNIVLGSIAAISLIVGGIGIMNIMLASITERTREIGIRRALGAKKRDITTQFLVETVVLSTAGGVFGIVLGVSIPLVIEHATDMRTIVTVYSLVLSFGISVGVGIVFGLYPANRAAAMDPIEALRRE